MLHLNEATVGGWLGPGYEVSANNDEGDEPFDDIEGGRDSTGYWSLRYPQTCRYVSGKYSARKLA